MKMPTYTLIFESPEDCTKIIYKYQDGVTIDDQLGNFACFLRAVGYHVDELYHQREGDIL